MADSASGFEELERHFEMASLALGRGDRAAAAEALRAAIREAEDRDDAIEPLTIALARLGDLELEDGHEADAEGHFQRALSLGERRLGAEHPDLVVLLNALSRLYLRRGAHELAEPILQRLYTIKRTKGEDHPEVATVLASLANVRQALGRHDAAELLWRRVLEIRERTLAPNHVATASALERLAETCAARAKAGESVQLMQRALAMRELTLGVGHPTVRALRERIADLQLQVTDEDAGGDGGFLPLTPSTSHSSLPSMPAWRSSTPSAAGPVMPAAMPPVVMPPVTAPPVTMPSVSLPSTPTSPSGAASAPAPAASTPRRSAPASHAAPVPPPPAAPFAAAPEPAPAPAPAFAPAPAPVATATAPQRPVMQYAPPSALTVPATDEHAVEPTAKPPVSLVMPGAAADGGLELQQLLAEIDADAEAEANQPSVAARAFTLLRDNRRPAIIAGVLVLLGAAFTVAKARGTQDDADPMAELLRTSTPTATALPGASLPATYGTDGVTSTAATSASAAGISLSGDNAAASRRAEAERSSASESRNADSRSSESRAETRASNGNGERGTSDRASEAAKPATVAAPLAALPNLRFDSIARAASAATAMTTQDPLSSRIASMSDKAVIGASSATTSRTSVTQPARLIGAVPVARYPQSLRQSNVQGEVRVTFEVDTLGRPDMKSLVILKSDHDLFTSSVRNVIPEMRFVPAEVDGKKARWLVRMPFVFSVGK